MPLLLILPSGFVLSHKPRNMTLYFPQSFAYRSLQGHGCVSWPPRCHSDPHTSTGRCCCDTGGTCSNPPHRRMAGTDLQIQAKAHRCTPPVSVTHSVCCQGFCVCFSVCVLPSSFFPACFLLMLDSSALQGESEKERHRTLVTNCRSLLFQERICLSERVLPLRYSAFVLKFAFLLPKLLQVQPSDSSMNTFYVTKNHHLCPSSHPITF